MTQRINENKILEYLKKFNKKKIRETKHSNCKQKVRNVSFNDITYLLLNETPFNIVQQESKKFALSYNFNEKYNLVIVIALKDKFIKYCNSISIHKNKGR